MKSGLIRVDLAKFSFIGFSTKQLFTKPKFSMNKAGLGIRFLYFALYIYNLKHPDALYL